MPKIKIAGGLVLTIVLGATAVVLVAMINPSDEVIFPGDIGADEYALTGELVRENGWTTVVSTAFVRNNRAYLVYTAVRDGNDDGAQAQPELTVNTGYGEVYPTRVFELMQLDGVNVGVLEVPLASHPAAYWLCAGDLHAQHPGASPVFRKLSSMESDTGTTMLNVKTLGDEFGFQTEIGSRAVLAPDVFASSLNVTGTGGVIKEVAVSIDNNGVLSVITGEELDAVVQKHTR